MELKVNWDELIEEYKKIDLDVSDLCISANDMQKHTVLTDELTVRKDNMTCCISPIAYDNATTYAVSTYSNELAKKDKCIDELKQKLEEAKHANEIMRTDSKAMAEGLVRREDKIKELEKKIEDLENKIAYCKQNGIWSEKQSTDETNDIDEFIKIFNSIA